ncbi:hypothetical protein FRB90_006203 [Tulasnella sp. 427]|nr:hypothetical protein FRB90_006203 [Tulasnella sp. 427]
MGAPLFDASGPLELTDFAKLHLPEFDPLVSTTSKSSKCLIPPKTYQVQRDGWSRSARIWALSSPCPPRSLEKSASLITDGSPTFNPLAAVIRRSTSTLKEEASNDEFFGFRVIDPLVNLPTHYIKHISGKVYALFEGPGGDDEYSHSKKVMDFQAESCFGATSTYTQHSGSAQHAVMRKVKGINPWWSM